MKQLTAARIVSAVKKQIATNPSKPIRFDMRHGDDGRAVDDALKELSNGFTSDKSKSWRVIQLPHPDPVKAKKGLCRVAILGPECPYPIESVTCPRKKARCDLSEESERLREKLQNKYGPDYYVELRSQYERQIVFDVWFAEDWLAVNQAPLHPVELVKVWRDLPSFKATIRWLTPMAEKTRKRKRHNKNISPKGGHATAINKDEDIVKACRDYKTDNPDARLSTAMLHLTLGKSDKPARLNYSSPENLRKRLDRMTKRAGLTSPEWWRTGCENELRR
jgi:hypothetical protein